MHQLGSLVRLASLSWHHESVHGAANRAMAWPYQYQYQYQWLEAAGHQSLLLMLLMMMMMQQHAVA